MRHGSLPGRLVDEFEREHPLEHIFLPGLGAREVHHRVVARRGLGQTCQHGEFGQAEGLHRLAEVSARCGLEAVGALPQVNLVDVKLENLVLGKIVLDLHRQHGFGQLAGERLFVRQEEVARHLHGDGRRTFLDPARQQVGAGRAQDAQRVHAAMRVEAFILGRDDGLLHVGRHLVDGDERPAFLTKFADQRAVCGVNPERELGFVIRQRFERRQIGINQCGCQPGERRAHHPQADDERQCVVPPFGKHPVPSI